MGFFGAVFLEAFGLFGVHKVNGEQACSLLCYIQRGAKGEDGRRGSGPALADSWASSRHVEMEFQFAFPSLSCSLFRLENTISQQHDMVRAS